MLPVTLLVLLALAAHAGEPSPIEDSNFFAESGRNRRDAVVQVHSFFLRGVRAHEIAHEWAAGSRHQLGYTLPLYSDEETGFGDAMLHCRYQLAGDEDSRIGVAPRLSLILPTRSRHFGAASSGLEIALPITIAPTPRLESHTNLNATWFRERGETETKWTQSLTFAVTPRLALSVEAAYTNPSAGDDLFVVRPGVQFSIDAPGGLRVTPGLAVPFGSEGGVLFFVSLERSVSR